MSLKNKIVVTLVVLIGVWSKGITAHAVEINGDFESGTKPGVYTPLRPFSNNISDWTITSGSIDYVGTEWRAANGSRSIDLNGITAGSINQKFTTKMGVLYEITFTLSGNPNNRPEWDGAWSPTNKKLSVHLNYAQSKYYTYDTSLKQNDTQNMKWEGHSYYFIASTTTSTLTFSSSIPGAFGPVLDNVIVNEVYLLREDQCKSNEWKRYGIFTNEIDCISLIVSQD